LNWFTSDLHLNHENIIRYCDRKASSTSEMNETIVSNWNSRISQNDTVYVVGDVFLGNPADAKPIIQRMNGKKILILGNHDRSPRTMLEHGFDEAHRKLTIILKDGRRALLCHKPLPSVLLSGCDLQVHGHRHNGPIVDGNRINVCVDLWNMSPISEDELCSIKIGSPTQSDLEVLQVGDEFEIKARVHREDMEGLLDHLTEIVRDSWRSSKK
jgi:calcineurin-like phosphoesterase family protein